MNQNYAIEIRLLAYGNERPVKHFRQVASIYHGSIFPEDASTEEINNLFDKVVDFVRNLGEEQD